MRSRFSETILTTLTLLLGFGISLNCHAQEPSDDAANTSSAATEMSPEALYEMASKAVVRLIAKNDDGQEIGSGSGFILDESHVPRRYLELRKESWAFDAKLDQTRYALVVTNYHVIEPAVHAQLEMPDGERGRVSRVAIEDPHADLAMLEVSFPETSKFESLSLADSSPAIGSTVFAIGNPLGLKATLTNGLVSGFRTDRPSGTRRLQTNAAISPGSSGGPLLDTRGGVLGVTSSTRVDGQNINFAVPSSEIKRLIMELNTRLAYFKGRSLWEGTSSKEAADSAIRDLDRFGRKLNFGDIDPKTDVLMKGVTAYRKDDFEEAIRLLRKAEPFIDREHRHLWHYAIGMSHIQFVLADGKFRVGEPHVQAGLEALTDAVTLVPDFGPAYSYLSFCYGLLQNDSMTLIASDSFVRTMPRCAAAYQSRGQAFQFLNDTRSAISDFRNSIRLNPMYDAPYSSLGLVYKSEKQMQKSIEMFKRAIAVTPPDNGFFLHHARLASVYQDVRDYELAIVHYQKALTLNPNESYELAIKESLAECEKLGRK